jgi:rhodanese-related sulfurtransferase
MPEDKNTEIITWCKISLRGYEAALVLQANGYQNVKVLEGGIMAWPYNREK